MRCARITLISCRCRSCSGFDNPSDGRWLQVNCRPVRQQPKDVYKRQTLAHVFNHGTHHRGQITAALTALGQPCPELDLVYFLQAEQAGTIP